MQTTREHLIEIGLQRIHKIGYTATGVMEILDLAGVPKGSFYHYFRSKEAFAQEVLQRYASREAQRWETILGDDKLPPLKRLRKYFNELVTVYGQKGPISGCLLGQMSVEVAEHSPDIQSLLSSAFDDWQQAIAASSSIAGRALWSGLRRKRVIGHSIPSSTSPLRFCSKSRFALPPANWKKEFLHRLIDRSILANEPIALVRISTQPRLL